MTHAVEMAGKIFAALKQCAAVGSECPSNKQLAERVGYKSTASVSDAINFLATAGMIEVERGNHNRVITICATGKRTAGVVRKAHHSAAINQARAT